MEIEAPPKERVVTEQERISLLRRSVYAFGGTIVAFTMVLGVLWANPHTTLGERIVNGAFSFAELVAMLYMGASVIDRTKLVDKVSEYWQRPGDRAYGRRDPYEREDYRRGHRDYPRDPQAHEDMR